MEDIEFVELMREEFKQEFRQSFSVVSNGYQLAFTGSPTSVRIIEMLPGPKYHERKVMFAPTQLAVTNRCFTTEILSPQSNFSAMHGNCNVEQSQELTLDPVYMAGQLNSEHVPGNVEAAWAPLPLSDNTLIIAVLTSFGILEVYAKARLERSWHTRMPNFQRQYASLMHPSAALYTPSSHYQPFKEYVAKYWLTAMCWRGPEHPHDLYTGSAAGEVALFRFNATFTKVELVFRCQTSLHRITYLMAVGEGLLLVSSIGGVVHLYRLAGEKSSPEQSLVLADTLWSKEDRMTVGKASYCPAPDSGDGYILVYAKAAHLMISLVSHEGVVVMSTTMYMGGYRIADLGLWQNGSFMVANGRGVLRRVHVSCDDHKELSFKFQTVQTSFSGNNHEVLAVVGSAHFNLWSVVYNRIAVINVKKVKPSHCIWMVYKSTECDPLERLYDFGKFTSLDRLEDILIEFKMDVLKGRPKARAARFAALKRDKFPADDVFMRAMQLELHFVDLLLPTQKYTKLLELQQKRKFLWAGIRLRHILQRLEYLASAPPLAKHRLQALRPRIAACLQASFRFILKEVKAMAAETDLNVDMSVDVLAEQMASEWQAKAFGIEEQQEHCIICGQPLDGDTMQCASAHQVDRCAMTFLQIPLFCDASCLHCNCRFLADREIIAAMYRDDEVITCLGCCHQIRVAGIADDDDNEVAAKARKTAKWVQEKIDQAFKISPHEAEVG